VLKPGATPAARLQSAGAIAPGTPVQESAVRYKSIRPLRRSLFNICGGVAVRTGSRQAWSWCHERFLRRGNGCGLALPENSSGGNPPCRAANSSARVLRALTCYIRFEHADIAAVEQPLRKSFIFCLFLCTTSASGAGAASAERISLLRLRGADNESRAKWDPSALTCRAICSPSACRCTP